MSLQAHIDYSLHLADNALVLGHRNSEWTGRGPILEQDIALSNIALDLIGQARYFYQYAAGLINESVTTRSGPAEATEDSLAYGRDGWDFRNWLLAEQSNGDWAKTILRQFLLSACQFYFYEQLQNSRDTQLAAIAEKSHKEVIYHLRWSSEWVIRLGDGTEESHNRMEHARDQLWKFTGELFLPADYEQSLASTGIAVDLQSIRPLWEEKVSEVFAEAQLALPSSGRGLSNANAGGLSSRTAGAVSKPEWMQTGGKQGRHTEDLGFLLAEMQFLQRAYPGCEW